MAVPVFICCSVAAEAPLATPVKALRNEGCSVEVMPGFEEDARAFGKVLDGNRGAGVYVVIQGLGVDQSIVRQLEGMFNARRGRDHQLAIVTLNPNDPMEILHHVRRALGGEEVRPPSPRKRSSNKWRSPTPPGEVVDADALARRLNAEMANAEAALTRSSHHRVQPANDGGPRDSVAEQEVDIDLADEPAVRPRWLWPAVGVAAAVTVVAVVMALGGGDPPPAQTPKERPVVASSVPQPEEPTAVRPAAAAPTRTPAPVEEAPADDTEEPAEPSYPGREAIVIANAIARGQVHSLDSLLWAKSNTNPVSYAEAATMCTELSPGGVGHFRLPGGKELKALRRARQLEPGTYWSASPESEGSDQQWVLDTGEVRLRTLSRIDGLARAVCVRSRR